jgi:integrase
MAKSRRRGSGEGLVRERADGRWEGRISLGWEGGKRKTKSYFAPTQAAVVEKLLAARFDHSKGLPIVIKSQTVQAFMEDWLEHSLKARAKARTFESFSTIAKKHIYPSLGKIQLAKLTPQHIQRLLTAKSEPVKDERGNVKKKGLSPQSRTNIRTVLRSALAQALKWGLVARNVAALVDAPRIPHKEVVPLDAVQANRLLEVTPDSRFEAVYVLALMLGMRRGEILGLRWVDISLESRTLRINQSLQRLSTGSVEKGKKSELRATETKTDGSRRTIALPDSVVKVLKSHRARQAEERLAAGAEWQDLTGLVFTNGLGRPIEPITLHRDYKTLLESAKLPKATRFHDLRHSAASLLLAQGVSPKMIADLLGHSRIGITMDLYGHILPAMRRDTADMMDQILGSR